MEFLEEDIRRRRRSLPEIKGIEEEKSFEIEIVADSE